MKNGFRLLMLALPLAMVAPTLHAQPPAGGRALSDTPAGRVAEAWFDAINTRSEAKLQKVIADHFTDDVAPEQRLKNWSGIYEQSGTLTPMQVIKETPHELVVRACESRGGLVTVGFQLKGDRIAGIRIVAGDEEQEPAGEPDRTPLTEAQAVTLLTQMADSLARGDQFAGVVRLERAGRVALERAWGESDRGKHALNRVDTKFNIGSINKNFTKAVIAKLIEQGKIAPDDTLSKHLPDFPRDKADRITIQQLLDMRSGLGDFFNARYDAIDKSKLKNQRDWFPLFVDDPLLYEPGKGQQYSNAGYCVLGALAEQVTGRNYYDLVREWVYQPAGMKNSDSFGQDESVANRAAGYTRNASGKPHDRSGPLTPNTPMQPWRGSAAGGGYSTAEDLTRYVKALQGGKILSAATTERFYGARRGEDGKMKLGLGIAGGSPGCNAVVTTRGDWILVVLANMDPPVAETLERYGRKLIERVDVAATEGANKERVTR